MLLSERKKGKAISLSEMAFSFHLLIILNIKITSFVEDAEHKSLHHFFFFPPFNQTDMTLLFTYETIGRNNLLHAIKNKMIPYSNYAVYV